MSLVTSVKKPRKPKYKLTTSAFIFLWSFIINVKNLLTEVKIFKWINLISVRDFKLKSW